VWQQRENELPKPLSGFYAFFQNIVRLPLPKAASLS